MSAPKTPTAHEIAAAIRELRAINDVQRANKARFDELAKIVDPVTEESQRELLWLAGFDAAVADHAAEMARMRSDLVDAQRELANFRDSFGTMQSTTHAALEERDALSDRVAMLTAELEASTRALDEGAVRELCKVLQTCQNDEGACLICDRSIEAFIAQHCTTFRTPNIGEQLPALQPLVREKVWDAVVVAWNTRDATKPAALERVTDAVMQFGTPAPTAADCVKALVGMGWTKRLARKLGDDIVTTDATDEITRSYVKAFHPRMVRDVLIAPTPNAGGING